MEESFWLERWERNQIGFHTPAANPLLVKHFEALSLAPGARLFLPLCGKTLDIHWLLARGHRVAGAELSRIAIEQLFAELGVEPQVAAQGRLSRYSAENIDVFVGDFFELDRATLGPVGAVYDRAALVALPPPIREAYARHLVEITARAPQLLIAYEYDQSLVDGPPFSVSADEVRARYAEDYALRLLESAEVAGGMKGKCPATEHVWRLEPR